MTLNDIYLLSPDLALACAGALVILIDLFVSRRGLPAAVGLAGIAVSMILSVSLWADAGAESSGRIVGVFGALAVDKFGLFFKLVVAAAAALVLLMSVGYSDRFARFRGEFYGLLLLSASGMTLLASATEFISIYVSLELTALPMAALAAFLRDGRSSESGMKFLILSAISSAMLLYGMVYIYGFTGTTSLEGIAERVAVLTEIGSLNPDAAFGDSAALLFGVVLVIAGFGFKISSAPFQFWAPDVYEGAPTPVAAFLSVASKAAGFAIILRVFYVSFSAEMMSENWGAIFAVLSVLSMTFGNLVAIRQNNIKRMLAYSAVAHAGYVMVGLAAVAASGGDALGPSGALFYLGGYVATNLMAFAVIVAVSNRVRTDEIDGYAGMARRGPLLAAAMAFAMISLTGIPPTVGFMSKVYLFGAAVNANLEWLAIAGMINSVISAYYYLRVVKVMYLNEAADDSRVSADAPNRVVLAAAAAATLVFGLYPAPLINLARDAVAGIVG